MAGCARHAARDRDALGGAAVLAFQVGASCGTCGRIHRSRGYFLATPSSRNEAALRYIGAKIVTFPLSRSEKPRKSRERKRSKCLKRQQPERREKYRERHYRGNRKQHHKLSKPSAKASIKILGFVFTRIVLPARELNDRAVLFSHLVSLTQNRSV
jgi:hypothetical protein